MRKWLARLALSFIAIAGVCAWEAYKGNHPQAKQVALAAGASVSAGLGIAGIRERYRQIREPRPLDSENL